MSRLLPEGLPLMKKALFKLYMNLNSTSKGYRRVNYLIGLFGTIIRQLHFVSIAIFSGSHIKNYSNTGYLPYVLTIIRLDSLIISLGFQDYFTILFILLISLNALSKIVLFIQYYTKTNTFIYIPLLVAKITSWIILNIFQIPFFFYGIMCIASLISSNLKDSEYLGGFRPLTLVLGLPVIFLTLVLYCICIFDCLLGNQPKYTDKSYTRAYSIIQVREIGFIILVSIVKMFVDSEYLLHLYAVIAFYNLYCYLYYLPYFSMTYNVLNAQTWITVIVSVFLVYISLRYDNFYITELNFLFLYGISILLNREAFRRRIEYIKNVQSIDNPYIHELKLRQFLFSEKFDLNDPPAEIIAKIYEHFKVANKHFIYFKLQYIWESLIIKRYTKDIHLSILKAVKVNTCLYNKAPHNSVPTKQGNYSYKYTLEIDYFLYSMFQKGLKKLSGKNLDLTLVRYFSYLNIFKELDNDITHALIEFTLSITSDTTSNRINNKILEIGKMITQYKDMAKDILKKFGMESKFTKIYGSFLRDVLNLEEGKELLKECGIYSQVGITSLTKERSDFDKTGPVLIISGWYKNIGTIVYANASVYSLLNISNSNKLIGTNFTMLIPQPFDTIHNNVLFRFLFHRNGIELKRAHLFLLDDSRNCIEVVMNFRIAFYKSNPYFIASFKPMLPAKNLILCSPQGLIYSTSEKVRRFFPSLTKNIQTSLPNISKYLEKYESEKIFEYHERDLRFLMKKSELSIDGFEMMIIYFIEHEFDDDASDMPQNAKRKKVHIEDYFTEDIKQNNSVKGKDFKRLDLSEKVKSDDNAQLNVGNRAARVLKISIRSLIGLEFILTLTILLIILQIIKSVSVNIIVFDLGLFRYLSSSSLSNSFSLLLLQRNFTLAYNETFYKATLLAAATMLEGLVGKYKEITTPILNEKKYYLNEIHLNMFKLEGTDFKQYDSTLLDAVNSVIQCSKLISKTNLTDVEELENRVMFMMRNVPSNYMVTLNYTVGKIMDDLINSLNIIFSYLQYVELLCIFPPLVLLLISIGCFYFIEITNRKIWNLMLNSSVDSLLHTRIKLVDRLYYVHEFEYIAEESGHKIRKGLYKTMVFIPFFKVLLLAIISLGFYLAITYGPQSLLLEMFKSELIHTNFGGMRRILTPLTLFWARNAIFEASGLPSYTNILPSTNLASSENELHYRIDQYQKIQYMLMSSLFNEAQSKFGFEKYMQLMIGDACNIINTIDNCTSTLVNRGLDPAMKMYLYTLEMQRRMAKIQGFNPLGLIKIEKYSKLVEKSFVFGLQIYANYTEDIVIELKNQMSLTTYLFFFFIFLVYILIIHKIADNMTSNLKNKVEILSVFSARRHEHSEKATTKGVKFTEDNKLKSIDK